jgi:hypothetical protein
MNCARRTLVEACMLSPLEETGGACKILPGPFQFRVFRFFLALAMGVWEKAKIWLDQHVWCESFHPPLIFF